jgi:putative transposase
MVIPERRRRAVVVLVERFGVSQRPACRLVGQHRSTRRRPPRPYPDDEVKLRARLREIARDHPRWGWKMAYSIVRREGGTSIASASSVCGAKKA